MSFPELKNALKIERGRVSVGVGTLGPSIDSLLKDSYLGQPLVITQARPGPCADENDTVVIEGRSCFMNVPDLPVRATFSLDVQGNPQVLIHYTLLGELPGPNDWKFSTSFPELPTVLNFNCLLTTSSTDPTAGWESPLEDLALFNARFVVASEARQDPDFQVNLERGINFVSKMRPTGIMGIFESIIGHAGTLTLYGTIRIPDATELTRPLEPDLYPWSLSPAVPPGISLRADLQIDPITLGDKLTFDVNDFRLYSPHSRVWLDENSTFQPVTAYTGQFTIPSAGVNVDITARVYPGYSEVFLSGAFEGVSVGKLANLIDVAGTGNLIDCMPDHMKKIGDVLGKLELTYAAVSVSKNASGLQVNKTSVAIGMPEQEWTVFDAPSLSIGGLVCRFDIDEPFSTPALNVTLSGKVDIEGVSLNIRASSADNYAVYAELGEAQTIPLKKLLATYAPAVPAPSDLTIDTFGLTVAPSCYYTIMASLAQEPNPWTIPLGPTGLIVSNVSLYLMYPQGGPLAGSFGGTIALGDFASMSMRYDIPGDVAIRAALPNVSLMQVVGALTDQTVMLPGGFDICLENTSVLIQKQGDNYVFHLGSEVKNFGSLALQIQPMGATWGYAAGLSMNPQAMLTNIQGLGGVGDLLSLFALDKLLLVVSSFDDPAFTFPDLAVFNDPTIRAGSLALPAQTSGIIAGLNAYGRWSFDTSQQQQLLKKFLGIDEASLDITLQIGEKPAQNAKLFASTTTKVGGLSLSAQFGGLIRNGQPGLFLLGTLVAPIQGHDYRFDTTLLFVANGAFLSGTMTGETAIDLGLFKLGNVALAVGISWECIPSLGIAGTIEVDTFRSSLAVFFNASNPAQSLVAGSVSDLTLKDVLDTLTGDVIPSEIDDVLDQVGVRGTDTIELPLSLADDLDNLCMDKVSAAFASKQVTVPSSSENTLLVVNEKGSIWYLTDLTNMRHYQLKKNGQAIEASVEAQFYMAPQATTIGEITFPQGFYLNGAIDVFGFDASARIDVDANKGIAVDAAMDRIVIGNETLFCIRAAEGTGGPRLSAATYPRDNDPVEEFRPPHFYINGGLEMLGVEREIFATLTQDGFQFDLNGDLVTAVNFDVHGHFNSFTDLAVGGALKIAVGTIDLGQLGKIPINTGVAGVLDLSVQGSTIKVDLDASFVFAGETHNLVTLHLDYNAKSLLDVAELVWEQVKKYLEDLLLDAAKWAEFIGKGFISGVEDMASVLKETYVKAAQEAAQLMQLADRPVVEIGNGLKNVYELTADGAVQVLQGIGSGANEVASVLQNTFSYGANEVANALQNTFNLTADAAAPILQGIGFGANEVASAMQNAFNLTADATAPILQGIGFGANEVASAMQTAFNLTADVSAPILQGIGFGVNEIGNALKNVYSLPGDTAVIILQGIGCGANEVADVLKNTFNYSATEVADVLKNTFNLSRDAASAVLQGIGYGANEVGKAIGSVFGTIGQWIEKLDPRKW